MSNYFSEVESDFYRYLTGPGGVNAHSRTNYMSWMRFLAEDYALPADLDEEGIAAIMSLEEVARKERDIYTTPRDMTNFKSALRKYRDFLVSDYRRQMDETVLAEVRKIERDESVAITERTAIVRSRVGQGIFRERLISYWRGCSISAYPSYDLLVASHIKPWRVADNHQRLDVFNGLLLLPNYDRLFDRGYISFDKKGAIIYSNFFPVSDRKLLGLNDSIHLLKIADEHKPYLEFHRKNCLMT